MKLSFSSIWSEFKSFAFKGNMIDLAVAVVIGGAFSGVTNSLVGDIIMPAVSYATTAANVVENRATDFAHEAAGKPKAPGSPSTTQASTGTPAPVAAAPVAPAAPAPAPGTPPQPVNLSWKIGRIEIGHFIASLLNFIIVAFAVFIMMVKILGSVMKKTNRPTHPAEPTTKECPECLSIIPYKAKRCSQCTAVLPPVEKP